MSDGVDEGVLGELGAMQDDFDSDVQEMAGGLDGDMTELDNEMPEMAEMDSEMTGLDGGNIENLDSDSLVGDGIQDDNNNDLFGNETGMVGDFASDYPVEEEFDNEGGEGPEMDLENGTVGSGEMEGEAFGSASSSFGESEISGTAGASDTANTGNGVLSEINGTGIDTPEGNQGFDAAAGITPEGNYAEGRQGADTYAEGAYLKGFETSNAMPQGQDNLQGARLSTGNMHFEKGIPSSEKEIQKRRVFGKKDVFRNFLKTGKSFARKRNQREKKIQQK